MRFSEVVKKLTSNNAIASKSFAPNSIVIKHISNFLPSGKILNMVSFGATVKEFALETDGISFADSYMMLTKKAENYVYAEPVMNFMLDFEHITDWEVVNLSKSNE